MTEDDPKVDVETLTEEQDGEASHQRDAFDADIAPADDQADDVRGGGPPRKAPNVGQ